MRVCYRGNEVVEAFHRDLSGKVLVDRFIENAIEIDVDALCDGEHTYIAAGCSTSRRPGFLGRLARAAGATIDLATARGRGSRPAASRLRSARSG
jgi:hypothetical protein